MLKEKLKSLKCALKGWNKESFGDVSVKVKDVIKEMNIINLLDEAGEASDVYFGRRIELIDEFWRLSSLIESILWQKSRSRWTKDRDRNSSYFHAVINKQRSSNFIPGIKLGGKWFEDPVRVKDGVMEYFKVRFQDNGGPRSLLDGVSLKRVK